MYLQIKGFREGDAVEIIKDKTALMKLQDGHGGVPKNMPDVGISLKYLQNN